MPLYDVKCTNKECEHQFEVEVKMDDADKVQCPLCHHPVYRLITNPKHYRHVSWSTWRIDHNNK